MMEPLRAPARMLFQSALVIFLVTIVIGVLNGMDLWEPSHELLLTHVHAGTLGWITLAVVGVALLVFGGADDVPSGTRVAQVMIATTVLYVLAFATTQGVLRPVAGTLELLAIVYVLVWTTRRRRQARRSVAALALYLALVSLVIGAVLGVLLGLYIANGSLPGLSDDMAGNLAGAHPPAMLAGYLLLAGFGIAEWRLAEEPALVADSKAGAGAAWALFAAGLLFNVGIIFEVEPLLQFASMLQVIAVVIFVVRMWSHLQPSAWRAGGPRTFARWSVVFLAVGIGLLVYLVQLFISGAVDPEAGEGTNILLAFDHALFIGLMTNALLSTTGRRVPWDATQRAIAWAVNLGLLGFLVGLITESALLKQVSTPIMGIALIAAVATHVRQRDAVATEAG
ncbi:MAG: hypothetical protein KY461_05020 [Actinobacteria bacterium]|nr:hypothetical protein [Actinomycetota bacterium]